MNIRPIGLYSPHGAPPLDATKVMTSSVWCGRATIGVPHFQAPRGGAPSTSATDPEGSMGSYGGGIGGFICAQNGLKLVNIAPKSGLTLKELRAAAPGAPNPSTTQQQKIPYSI